ncbi:MAG: carboxypeptidase-like regulatory domain-containing protein, partial [bacterium]
MLRRKFLSLLIFIFCVHGLALGETDSSPVISLGKVCTKWKGFLNIPFWTDSTVSFTGITPITLPKESTSFKFGLNWRGENETRAPQKCTIIINVEVETYPNSDKWTLLFEEANDIISRGGVVEEKPIVTRVISQEKPEVRYKIIVRTVMPFGQEMRPNTTYITVRLTSKVYTTYTSIPIIPLTILHDPNGDESYTCLQPQTCITHLLNINIAGMEVKIEDQEELLLESQKAKIKINSVAENEDTVKISYTTEEKITSAISKDPCLIGPGIGDTYVLIKDLPVKFKFSKTFTPSAKEIKSLTFCIVSPQEAGLSPKEGFDIILIPAAVLRSYDRACPIFGRWEKLDLDDQIRQQLIEMNIGWDNYISEFEKSDVVDLGEGYLNFKDQTIKNYTQLNLNKVSFYSEMVIEPYFAAMAGIPISRDKILAAITLNDSPINKTIPMENLIVTLEDDDRQNIPGDFFTYQFYQDRRFGSLLFITKDDKSKPATFDSLHTRSFSSKPKEYWTEDLTLIPVEVSIYGLITSTTGEGIDNVSLEIRLNDEVVKKATTKPGGTYTITGLIQGTAYTLIANIDGYKSKTIEITPLLDKELAREINIVLEKIPPKIVEVPPVEEVVVKKPPVPPTTPVPKPQLEELPARVEEVPPKEEKPTPLPPKAETPPIPPKEEVHELLTNGDFSSELKAWKLVKIGAGKEMYAKVIKSDFTYPFALEIKRTGSMWVNGEMGVKQILNKEVSKYTQLVLKVDVKVIHSSLESDGRHGGVY